VDEVAFPVLGSAFVLSIILPLGALVAKLALLGVERSGRRGAVAWLPLRYFLVVSSSAVPLAWFFSAGVHQAESGRGALACLLGHSRAERCLEPFLFSALLGCIVLALWLRICTRRTLTRQSASPLALLQKERIERLLGEDAKLRRLKGRIVVTDGPLFTLCVEGFFRPQVVVGARFAEGLAVSLLRSALAHEQEHIRSYDPLRYALLDLALAVNPLGMRLIGGHVARFKTARELECDREAVLHGAEPLSLAEAIVRAARPSPAGVVSLSTDETAILKLRVGLLLAFAERAPQRSVASKLAITPLGFLILLGAVLLPHETDSTGLDAIHATAEYTLAYFQP